MHAASWQLARIMCVPFTPLGVGVAYQARELLWERATTDGDGKLVLLVYRLVLGFYNVTREGLYELSGIRKRVQYRRVCFVGRHCGSESIDSRNSALGDCPLLTSKHLLSKCA